MAGEQHIDNAGNTSPDPNPKRKKRLGEGIGEGILRSRPAERAPQPPRALDLTFDRVVAEAGKETKKPKPEQKAEGEAQLTDEETAAVAEQLVAARSEAIDAERAEVDPQEHAALDADGEYLDDVSRRIQSGEAPQEAMDAAYDDAVEGQGESAEGEFGSLEDEGEVPLRAYNAPSRTPELPIESGDDSTDAANSQQSASIFSNSQPNRAAAPRAEAMGPAIETSSEPGMELAATGIIAALVASLMRGRRNKKTGERRAQAMQRGFERQVRGLHEQLTQHEAQIRQLVREREAAPQPAVRQTPEARPAVASQVSQEQKTAQSAAPHNETVGSHTNVEQLEDDDLFAISQKVEIGRSNLYRMYEADRISKRGLKRLVAEHLRGGNVRDVLKQELLIKAIGPELDPLLRDQPSGGIAAVGQAPVAAADGSANGAASQPVQAAQPTAPTVPQPLQTPHVTPGLVFANVIALTILGILFLVLFVTWALH